jgi:hypothetical protein
VQQNRRRQRRLKTHVEADLNQPPVEPVNMAFERGEP